MLVALVVVVAVDSLLDIRREAPGVRVAVKHVTNTEKYKSVTMPMVAKPPLIELLGWPL